MNKIAFFGSAWVLVSLLAGCGDSGVPLVPAEGTITKGGAPLSKATITVMYGDGNPAQAISDDQGKFVLTYLGKNGAPVGTGLKVTVSKRASQYSATASKLPTGEPKTREEEMALMNEAMKSMNKGTADARKSGNEIDDKYDNPATSGLTLEIPAGGSKELKIAID